MLFWAHVTHHLDVYDMSHSYPSIFYHFCIDVIYQLITCVCSELITHFRTQALDVYISIDICIYYFD
jgi:hypothetical protein